MMTEQLEMCKKHYKGNQRSRLQLKLLTQLSGIQQLEEGGGRGSKIKSEKGEGGELWSRAAVEGNHCYPTLI